MDGIALAQHGMDNTQSLKAVAQKAGLGPLVFQFHSVPRKSRIDASGALHHIIARGIECSGSLGVSLSVKRGERIVQENDYKLIEL